jgi:hypothetical protein
VSPGGQLIGAGKAQGNRDRAVPPIAAITITATAADNEASNDVVHIIII